MPVDRAAPPYLDLLRASGLLEPGQLAELARYPEARDPNPTALARVVFQRGWLTRFQLNMVAAGRAKELTVGTYVLLDRLGEGGMGMVYKARHRHLQRIVALKVIRREKLAKPDAVRRFYQEVQVAGQLHHPNIVLAYDADQVGNTHYFAMEYVDGIDLSRLVKEQGKLPVPQACEYVRQAALGLQHAREKGMVHRDIKPANLLVSRAPEKDGVTARPGAAKAGDVVKILDMGLARVLGDGDTGLTRLGAVIGTPDYIAPEQAMNSKAADTRADLYSLGCTLYYLLTGGPPFTGNELTEVLLKHQMEKPAPLAARGVEAPAAVQAILDRLMAKKPADRYQTPADLVVAITPFCREGTLSDSAFHKPHQDNETADDDPWGALTFDDGRGKTRGRATAEVSRTGTGARVARRKQAEAGRGRKLGLMVAAAGGGALALAALGVILYLALGDRSDQRPVANGPRSSEAVKKETGAAGDDSKRQPTHSGREQPVEQPGEGDPGPAVLAGGRRVKADLPGFEFGAVDDSVLVTRAQAGQLRVSVPGAEDRVGFEVPGTRIDCFALSADGKKLLTAHSDHSLRLWDVGTGKDLHTFTGHTQPIAAVAISPDGRLAISGGGTQPKLGPPAGVDAAIRVWDLEGLQPRGQWQPSDNDKEGGGALTRLAFSPDGKQAVSFHQSVPRIWEVATGKQRTFTVKGDVAECAALSPDGTQLALGTRAGKVFLLDATTGAVVREMGGQRGWVRYVTFTPDGRRVVAAGGEGAPAGPDGRYPIHVWDAADGRPLHAFPGHTKPVRRLAVTGEGQVLYSAGQDGAVWRWDLGPSPQASPSPGPVTGGGRALSLPAQEVGLAAFSPDGKRLVIGGAKLRLWDVEQDKEVHAFGGPRFLAVRDLAWSADGRRVLVGGVPTSGTGGVAILFKDTGEVMTTFSGHPNEVSAVALSSDGREVLTAGGRLRVEDGKPAKGPDGKPVFDDTEVRRWDAVTGKELRRYRGPTTPVQSLGFAADGKTFCAASAREQAAYVWEPDTAEGRRVPFPTPARDAAVVSARGREVAYLGADAAWHVFDLKDGQEKHHSEPFSPRPVHLAWSRDGHSIACGSFKPRGAAGSAPVFLTDAATGKVVRTFEGHPETVVGIALSDDGRLVFSHAADGARLWDRDKAASPAAEKDAFNGHVGEVLCVALSPDGKKLLSGGKDKTVRVWDVVTGKELKKFNFPNGTPIEVAFVGKGDRAVARSVDAGFISWTLDPGQLLHSMGGRLEGAGALSPDGERMLLWPKGGKVITTFATTEPGARVGNLQGSWGEPAAVRYSPDGRSFVCVAADGVLHLGNLATEKEVGKGFPVSRGDVTCLAVAPKLTHVAVAEEKSVALWNLQTLQTTHHFSKYKEKVLCLDYSADGKHIVTGSADATVRVWDAANGKELKRFTEHKAPVRGVAFSPDGKSVVSCGDGIRLWEWDKQPAKP
jgi:WD40 repeat protein/serine/threonine protein kinase